MKDNLHLTQAGDKPPKTKASLSTLLYSLTGSQGKITSPTKDEKLDIESTKLLGKAPPKAGTPYAEWVAKWDAEQAKKKADGNTPPREQIGEDEWSLCGIMFPRDNLYYSAIEPRTQKLKGLLELRESEDSRNLWGQAPVFRAIQCKEDLDVVISIWDWAGSSSHYGEPLFARPCPIRPRHGFVDSRIVTTSRELVEIWAEAQQHDPQAELILMEVIPATGSAIYTPNSLSIGPGHDGATSGNDSFFIAHEPPLATNAQNSLKALARMSGVAEEETPYLEIVYPEPDILGDTRPAIPVQIRSGVKVESCPDYIPERMQVLNIISPNGEDLIEWESRSAQFPPGTVVYHPGGTRASHYALHCIHNKTPYITTYRPKLNSYIQATTAIPAPDLRALRDGILAGTHLPITFKESINLMLYSLHSSGLNHHATGWKMLGLGLTQCLRLGTAACLGEYRHHQKLDGRLERDQIYKEAWEDLFPAQRKMTKVWRSFATSRWKSGYGGRAWGACAEQNLILWLDTLDFLRQPTEQHALQLASTFNIAVNVAHNNGWMFDKFASATLMSSAANCHPSIALNAGRPLLQGLMAPAIDHGWGRVRRSRVLSVDLDNSGKRALVDTPGGYTAPPQTSQPEKKPKTFTKLHSVQGCIRGDNILHVQYKIVGLKSYATFDIVLNSSSLEVLKQSDQVKCSHARTTTEYYLLVYNHPDNKLVLPNGETIIQGISVPQAWRK